MTQIARVFVTVPQGRMVPFPESEITAAGGLLIATAAEEGKPPRLYAVPWTTYTRKRIAAGDLELATKEGKRATSRHAAAAPADVKLAPDGTVDPDQRTDAEINLAIAKEAAEAKGRELAAASRSSDTTPASTPTAKAAARDTDKTGKDRS